MLTVDRIINAAFRSGQPRRSDAFRAGVRAMLLHRIDGEPSPVDMCPYQEPSTEFNDYFYGVIEGDFILSQSDSPSARHPAAV